MATQPIYFKLPTGSRTPAQINAKIAVIDAIIESLETTAMTSVGNADVIEYEIETGQTKTKVEYTTPGQVLNVLEGYERFRQMYVNKLIPRVVSLRDQRNFRRG